MMNVISTRNALRNVISTLAVSAMLLPAVTLADSEHGHSNMKEQGHMMKQDHMKSQGMREVMGTGRINKVMAEKHMVNIVHEPIAEMEWPKMRMNFKTAEGVNLNDLKPGQEVTFKLQVNKDNSYVIKQIDVK
ncbi:copper-binding protein [Alkalimarinus alittae]|uniref:Copper-binding protein n=1 Tax=Alkalimarinus alittae TaxID=2961619 RepID=A0ABY6MZS2_9ALTE|nr:copper-binding protein [Alkalimarinus alittae]UZE95319.1 copper-binding protein [Alkalimarinus alittae]